MAQENTKDSMTNDIAASAQTVQKAAGAAVSAGKAAAKAATGNVAGAAVEVVKNKELRNFIIGLLVVIFILPVLAFLSLPAIVFAGSEELAQSLDEQMLTEIADSGNSLEEFFLSISYLTNNGSTVSAMSNNVLKNTISSVLNKGEKGEAVEEFDPVVYAAVYDEESAVQAIQTQIDKVIRRFDSRREQYEKLFNKIVDDYSTAPPSEIPYDYFHLTTNFDAPEVTEEEALQYLTAYSIQTGNDYKNITLRSLLSWIGYYNGIFKTDDYVVNGKTYSTYDWHGDFLPQYQYEQLLQEEKYGVSLSSFQPDSFLEQVYYVDKATGISVNYEYIVEQEIELVPVKKSDLDNMKVSDIEIATPDEEAVSEEDEEDEIVWIEQVVEKTHLYITITMTITKADVDTVATEILGFWDGSLTNRDPDTGINRAAAGVPAEYLTYSWTDNGYTFTRLNGYQTSYYEDMLYSTADYLGIKTVDLGNIDFSIVGATVASTQAAESVVSIAESQLGTIGGDPYWNLGEAGQDWCNWFVKWCGLQAGLDDLFGFMSGGVIKTWELYGGYIDRVNVRYRSSSNQYGTAIVVDETVLLDSDRLSSDLYIPQRGDLVFFADTRPGMKGLIAHIGIVESYDIYTNDLVTIEGNTTPGTYINNRLSGVYNMHRTTTQKFGTNYKTYNIVGFIHLNYPEDQEGE